MAFNFLVQLLIAVALSVVSYLLTPKPKGPKTSAAKDLEFPVAEAGKPLPKVFGTLTVKGVNCMWYGDKSIREYKVRAG